MNNFILEKKKEYEGKYEPQYKGFGGLYQEDGVRMRKWLMVEQDDLWNFIEDTIKETLLMAKEKTMLEDITPKNYNQVFLGARAEGMIDGYTQAISDTEERWKDMGV